MFFCECGGLLVVIRVEQPPEELPKNEKLLYNRLCDVQCNECKKLYILNPMTLGSH